MHSHRFIMKKRKNQAYAFYELLVNNNFIAVSEENALTRYIRKSLIARNHQRELVLLNPTNPSADQVIALYGPLFLKEVLLNFHYRQLPELAMLSSTRRQEHGENILLKTISVQEKNILTIEGLTKFKFGAGDMSWVSPTDPAILVAKFMDEERRKKDAEAVPVACEESSPSKSDCELEL